MLKFSGRTPELEHLNELGYRLPLNDSEIKRMQNLNRSWSAASAQTTERFRYDKCINKTINKVLYNGIAISENMCYLSTLAILDTSGIKK